MHEDNKISDNQKEKLLLFLLALLCPKNKQYSRTEIKLFN